jgi:hypothetical protein
LFSEAPVLQKLLAYLAEKSLDGGADDLKEYVIGVELFGNPDNYSPQVDPSVRVQAGRLRRKLDEYYRTEGSQENCIIQVPKGAFCLVLRERVPETDEVAPETPEFPEIPLSPEPPPILERLRRHAWVLAAVLAVVCAGQFVWVRGLREKLAQTMPPPALMQMWEPVLHSRRPLLLVYGAPLFIEMQGGLFRNAKVNTPDEVAKVPEVAELLRRMNISPPHFGYTYAGVGDVAAVYLLGRLFQSAGKDVTVSRSNDLGWDEAASHDLILLGSSKSQRHMRELGMLVNYRLVPGGIQVIHPEPGEPSFYRPTAQPHETPTQDYCIMARLPGIDGKGYIVLIGGDSTGGTWGGAEFVTNPQYAKALVQSLGDKSGRLPEYFEMIIETKLRNERPVAIRYVRHRRLAIAGK